MPHLHNCHVVATRSLPDVGTRITFLCCLCIPQTLPVWPQRLCHVGYGGTAGSGGGRRTGPSQHRSMVPMAPAGGAARRQAASGRRNSGWGGCLQVLESRVSFHTAEHPAHVGNTARSPAAGDNPKVFEITSPLVESRDECSMCLTTSAARCRLFSPKKEQSE